MAKKNESVGSDRMELKKLLNVARGGPVHMAFAAGANGKAIIKLDKMKPPRALEKMLKDEDGSKNHRYGSIMIDPADHKLARFVVNKEISGFARKLAVALKDTGISKVVIMTVDGTAVEQAEDAEVGVSAETAPPPASGRQRDAKPAPGAVAQLDSAVQRKLTKASQVWDATVAKVTRDVEQLVAVAKRAGAGHALGDSLDDYIRQAAVPLLQTVDGRLARLLEAAAGQDDDQQRQELLEHARKAAKQLGAFAQTSPVVAHLDNNPFIPLVIGKTLGASLAALSAVIR